MKLKLFCFNALLVVRRSKSDMHSSVLNLIKSELMPIGICNKTSFYTVVLVDIPYLRELALNNNPLQKIEGHAFEMVPQIVSLDVSGNLRLPTLLLITILNPRLSNKKDLGEGISQYSRAGEAAAPQQQDRGDQAEDGGQS